MKVKSRKIESERRSASKTSNLRISLFTSIKDRHCIQTTRILVNRPAINANDPMPPLSPDLMRVAKRNGSDTTNLSKSPSPPMLDQCGYPQKICITFVQSWPNVSDVVPALYKCYRSTNVLCLLGRHFATSSWEFTGLCRYVTGIFLFSLKSVAC